MSRDGALLLLLGRQLPARYRALLHFRRRQLTGHVMPRPLIIIIIIIIINRFV